MNLPRRLLGQSESGLTGSPSRALTHAESQDRRPWQVSLPVTHGGNLTRNLATICYYQGSLSLT